MVVIQTTLDLKSMTVLARATRKTLRWGSSTAVRLFACGVFVVELLLARLLLRVGDGRWILNLLLGLFMLGCVLWEDRFNGMMSLRQTPLNSRVVNATFQDSSYVQRTQAGEQWWPYGSIKAIVEAQDYFAQKKKKNHGQIYDKKGFSWGDIDQFRELIQRKTGLKIQYVK